ncbi:MAG: hypothetical protein WB919_06750 [Candidatus Sulfotelmatobacter sp.]
MRSITGRLVVFAIAGFVVLMWRGRRVDSVVMAQQGSAVTATRLYTGDDGLTHAEQVEMKFSPVAGAPATLEESERVKPSSSYLVRTAPGYFHSWRNADVHRWVIPISGRAEIEVAGGQKLYAEPGKIIEADDLKGKGHTFPVVGNEDWVAVFVDMGQ